MIAFSIEWHKNCLKNHKRTNEEERAKIERMVATLERSEKMAAFYAIQIEAAEKKGKESFDSEKFMKKERLAFLS